MKTLIFQSNDGALTAEVKADIFATATELATIGFDTKFTNMEITKPQAAVALGFNLQEIENGFQASKALAIKLNLNLNIVDINEGTSGSDVSVVGLPKISAGPDQAVAGDSGAVDLAGVVTSVGSSPIDTILWELVSGPETPTFDDEAILAPSVTGIDTTDGTYVFKITVTNTDGVSETDSVEIVVS